MTKKTGRPCVACGSIDRDRRGDCLACNRTRSARWKLNNPEKVQQYRTQNKENESRRNRNWQQANPEIVRAKRRRWSKEHPESGAAQSNRRRTRKTEAGGSYTAADWKALVKQQNGRCLACGKKAKLTADHVVPVTSGGSSDISNIQGLCKSCNSSKGTKTTDYRTKDGFWRWIQEKLL